EVVSVRRDCVGLAEVAELLRAVRLRLQEVVELQPELAHELLELEVAVVDQLAAVLVDLAFREVATAREAPAADPAGPFEDLRGEYRLLQPVGGDETGETGADDNDPSPRRRPARGAGRPRGPPQQRSPRARRARGPQRS